MLDTILYCLNMLLSFQFFRGQRGLTLVDMRYILATIFLRIGLTRISILSYHFVTYDYYSWRVLQNVHGNLLLILFLSFFVYLFLVHIRVIMYSFWSKTELLSEILDHWGHATVWETCFPSLLPFCLFSGLYC